MGVAEERRQYLSEEAENRMLGLLGTLFENAAGNVSFPTIQKAFYGVLNVVSGKEANADPVLDDDSVNKACDRVEKHGLAL